MAPPARLVGSPNAGAIFAVKFALPRTAGNRAQAIPSSPGNCGMTSGVRRLPYGPNTQIPALLWHHRHRTEVADEGSPCVHRSLRPLLVSSSNLSLGQYPIGAVAIGPRCTPIELAGSGTMPESVPGAAPEVERGWAVNDSQASGSPAGSENLVAVLRRMTSRRLLRILPPRGARYRGAAILPGAAVRSPWRRARGNLRLVACQSSPVWGLSF